MRHRSRDSGWVFRAARAADSEADRRGKADLPIAETAADRAVAPVVVRAGRKGEGKAADSFAAMDREPARATGRAAKDRHAARPTATSLRAILDCRATTTIDPVQHERSREMFVYGAEQKVEDQGGGVTRKVLAHGGGLMQVEVAFAEGAVGPLHSHPHEQLTYVMSGEFEFTIGDETRVVRAGDTLYKKPGVMHGCRCLKPGVLLDTFTPQRSDFLPA